MAPSCVLRPSRLLTQPGKHCSTPAVFWIFTATVSCFQYPSSMSIPVGGLHHVTAIASDPQPNLNFYVGLLGLRLVKRTINFDDPGTYHFYYGDSRGTPGTILTFFSWPNARRGGRGTGQIEAAAFAIAPASVGFWLGRLNDNHVPAERAPLRFEQEVIRFADPDGMILELIASAPGREVEAWTASSVPAEHSLRGFHSVSAALEGYESSAKLLTEVFGYELMQEKGNRFRFAPPDMTGPARMIDLLCMPDTQHARSGAGTVHHIAFRTPDGTRAEARRTSGFDRQRTPAAHSKRPSSASCASAASMPDEVRPFAGGR